MRTGEVRVVFVAGDCGRFGEFVAGVWNLACVVLDLLEGESEESVVGGCSRYGWREAMAMRSGFADMWERTWLRTCLVGEVCGEL